jgi:hypothetical protein
VPYIPDDVLPVLSFYLLYFLVPIALCQFKKDKGKIGPRVTSANAVIRSCRLSKEESVLNADW